MADTLADLWALLRADRWVGPKVGYSVGYSADLWARKMALQTAGESADR